MQFGDEAIERIQLDDTSWVDVGRGWLPEADELFEGLLRDVSWQTSRLFRYDHWVEERRLSSMWRRGLPLPHPDLAGVHKALQSRYRVEFDGFGLIQYRDGNDGQAFHRDTDMRWLDETLVVVLSLGAERPWLLRPRTSKHDQSPSKGATHDLRPGPGDLVVMGWPVPGRLGALGAVPHPPTGRHPHLAAVALDLPARPPLLRPVLPRSPHLRPPLSHHPSPHEKRQLATTRSSICWERGLSEPPK